MFVQIPGMQFLQAFSSVVDASSRVSKPILVVRTANQHHKLWMSGDALRRHFAFAQALFLSIAEANMYCKIIAAGSGVVIG